MATHAEQVKADGRAAHRKLLALSQADGDPEPDPSELAELDHLLQALAQSARLAATSLSLGQLRSTLPPLVAKDRAGVLYLLDLILEDEQGIGQRIFAIDYLVTLLSTELAGGQRRIAHDPVKLTPTMARLCAESEIDPERAAAVEAEFFAASAIEDPDALSHGLLFQLRSRKIELGRALLAPGLLRASTTYNAAMWNRIEEWVVRTGIEWDDPFNDADDRPDLVDGASQATSVFESDALRDLLEAVRRRLAGSAQGASPVDRVVWCLDFESLGRDERRQLAGPAVGTREDLIGTAMIVCLLCRSSVVLGQELDEIGIDAVRMEESWVAEIDGLLRAQINARIAQKDFGGAKHLSDLRNRFLYEPMAQVHQSRRCEAGPANPAEEPAPLRPSWSARDRHWARQGLEESTPTPDRNRSSSRALTAGCAFAAAAALCMALLSANGAFLPSPVETYRSPQLSHYSPYLTGGYRDGKGSGPLFVGTIDAEWARLPAEDRARLEQELLQSLRDAGVRRAMIYDDERRLRIHASFPATSGVRT